MSVLDTILQEILTKLYWYIPVLILPFVVILIWMVLFYNGSPILTQAIVQLIYIFVAIPLLVLIFLSVALITFGLALSSLNLGGVFGTGLFILFIVGTLTSQFFYVMRLIRTIERKEKLPILQVISREFNSEYRKEREEKRKNRVHETRDFFDQITVLTSEKKAKDRAERDRLRRVLTGDFDNTENKKD